MRLPVILLALALPVLVVADRAPNRPVPRSVAAASAPSAAAGYSPAQLQRLRQSLVAQIAAWDEAEGLRAPTPGEAAALALPAGSTAVAAVALPGGGVALRSDASQMSLAMAEVADDGSVRVTERTPSRRAHVPAVKGGAYVR